MATKPRLYWKLEDVADGQEVGPAWLDSEKVRGGEWITRAEAREIARENDYRLQEDDGRSEAGEDKTSLPSLDVAAINEKLRSLGIGVDDLTVEHSGGHVLLRGPLLEQLKTEPSRFRTAAMVTSPEQAAEVLDRLAPGWRD